MLQTKALLALLGVSMANAISIQIDVEDGTPAIHQEQLPMLDGSATPNPLAGNVSTMISSTDQVMGPVACPTGDCPGLAVCPDADKSIRIAQNGQPYMVYCNTAMNVGNNYETTTNINSLQDCLDLCEGLVYCIAAQYYVNYKYCYTLRNINVPGTPQVGTYIQHSAAKINMEVPRIAKCPEDNNKLIRTNNKDYRLYCEYSQAGTTLDTTTQKSMEECAQRCDTFAGCVQSVYIGTTCYLKGVYAIPPKGTDISDKKDAAVLVPVAGVRNAPKCCPSTKKA